MASNKAYISFDLQVKAAKAFGKTRGYKGNHGGWVYAPNGAGIAQGWFNVHQNRAMQIRDWLTRELTAFNSFGELVSTPEMYSPTIIPRTWREQYLADAFDIAMQARGSQRRAWRGSQA